MDMTPAEIIEQKGGAAVIAGHLGVDPTVIRMWKSRNRIPRTAWPELSATFPDLSTEALLQIEANGQKAAA